MTKERLIKLEDYTQKLIGELDSFNGRITILYGILWEIRALLRDESKEIGG